MAGVSSSETETGFQRPLQPSHTLLVVLGFVVTLAVSTKVPLGNGYVVPGRVSTGVAVVTVSDIYLVAVVVGLVSYRKRMWIPRSPVLFLVAGFVATILVSALVNGLTVESFFEVVQWIEMGALATFTAVMIHRDWQRRRILATLVTIGVVRSVWILAHLGLHRHAAGRPDIFIEGAALVVVLGLLVHERVSWYYFACSSLVLLVILGEERKVWVAIAASLSVMAVAYVLRNQRSASVDLVKKAGLGSVLVGAALVTGVIPEGVVGRASTLISVVPGVGGPAEFERLYIYRTGLNMFLDNPLVGVGPENWFQAKSEHATENLVAWEQENGVDIGTHSLFVKTLAEIGGVGFGLLVLLVCQPLRLFGWYSRRDEPVSELYLPLLGLFVYVVSVAALRSSGVVVRGYLFLVFGLFVSSHIPDSVPERSDGH